ncbi:methyltransferase-like 26 B [Conger conger]|uniref:methyltransferase-like 26 B n=1 Tax=Conger conger TaxID=82655 RepID=UPI002A5A7F6A|nr:methyltransferase-like 26 B [Conger conger]XP_061080837.1 methyltransferase-like 26 B [Conger conger]
MLLCPAVERNQDGLLSVLSEQLGQQSHRELFALELGSGTGQHVVHFAQGLPFVTWQPSDINEEFRDSIRSYIVATKVKTVLEPLHLDAGEPWEKWAGLHKSSCDIILSINMLQHCSFGTIEGVFKGSGQILRKDGFLMTYGPYAINGIIAPSSNEELDQTIREKNPEWGLPDVDVLRQLAFSNGMRLERMMEMPESNKCLIFRKL